MCKCLERDFERKGRAVLCGKCNRFLYKVDEEAYHIVMKIVAQNIMNGNIKESKSANQLLDEIWNHAGSTEELTQWYNRSVIKTN